MSVAGAGWTAPNHNLRMAQMQIDSHYPLQRNHTPQQGGVMLIVDIMKNPVANNVKMSKIMG